MAEKATTEELRLILKYITKGYDVPDIIYNTIKDIAIAEVEKKEKIVCIKRDPDIHYGRIQAAYVKVIDGETMDIHPAQVGGFGADFDGDAMAMYVPLSEEAQQEAKQKLMTPIFKDKVDSPSFDLSKEALTGIYTLTEGEPKGTPKQDISIDKAKELPVNQSVTFTYHGEKIKTIAGRVIFNSALPNWYKFVNEPVTKKVLSRILSEIIQKDKPGYVRSMGNLTKIGFEYCTSLPKTVSLDLLRIPKELYKLRDQLGKETELSKQMNIIYEIEDKLRSHLKENVPDLYHHLASGASKDEPGSSQIRQIMVAKGLVSDPKGNILPPITKAMNEGFSPSEYFDASSGSRKGIIDRTHNTAEGGYAYRKMVYVMGDVQANINEPDCETTRTLNIKLTNELFKRMSGRYVLDQRNNIRPVTKEMIGSVIKLRTPIYCKTKKICRICYGDLLKQINSQNVGHIAAQEVASLSERIMKCSDGLVQHNNRLITLKDLYDEINSEEINNDGFLTKTFEDKIKGKDGLVNTYTIQKHYPTDEMLFISTKSGNNIVCQANHPMWAKLNNLHDKYPNKTCRLIGDELYTSCGSSRSVPFKIDNNEMFEVEAKDLNQYDCIWIDNSFAMNNEESFVPPISGYVVGAYMGDGFTIKPNEDIPEFEISQLKGVIRERIKEELNSIGRVVDGGEKYIVCKDKDKKLYDYVLGDRCNKKRLAPNFISYDKQWLKDFLSGLIDTDGTVFGGNEHGTTCCRIYTSSYYLVQQLKAICLKLGYRMNTTIVCDDKEGCKGEKRTIPHFSCDIRFHKDSIPPDKSEKLNSNGEVVKIQGLYNDEYPKRGFDVITKIKKIKLWNQPVYDIKTESNEYLLGFVQNHNSFHLGGSVHLQRIDLYKELMQGIDDTLESHIKAGFIQDGNTLVTNIDTQIVIDKQIYHGRYSLTTKQDYYILPVGYFDLFLEKFKIPVMIDQETFVFMTPDTKEDDRYIYINYKKGTKVFHVEPKPLDPTEVARKLNEFVGGKVPWKTVENLYMTFFKTISPTGDWDSVHLEVIISNILRSKKDPQKPARLSEPFDPTTFSIKALPSIISWPLGIAFEDFGKSIQQGLISKRGVESPIEKVLFGQGLTEKKGKRRK